MARPIVKLTDGRYLEWTTVADAPTTYSVERDEAVQEWTEARVARADIYGTSLDSQQSAEDLISFNRAGPNQTCLTIEEICRSYHPDNAPNDPS